MAKKIDSIVIVLTQAKKNHYVELPDRKARSN